MAGPWEQYAEPDGPWASYGEPTARITVTPQRPDEGVMDVAKSLGSGVARGTAMVAGVGGDISKSADTVIGLMERAGFDVDREKFLATMPQWMRSLHDKPKRQYGSKEIMESVDRATGAPVMSYKPQTTAGRYARTVGEFVPGAMLGPGGVVRNAVNFAVVPGLASEAAGQATEGTAAEPWARAGAAVATGGAAALLNRPSTPERAIRNQMPTTVNREVIDRAEALMADARQRGINLTWAEALEQVAPGTGLTNMQRTLEATPGSRERMGQFFADRPNQVERAARNEFDAISPANPQPSTIGPAVGREAENAVNDVRGVINRASEPFYTAAERHLLTPQEMAQVRALPGFEEARAAVRNDPQLNRYVAGLPDESVGFLNEVKKQLDQMGQNARAPVNAQQNMQRAAGYELDAGAVRDAGTHRSPEYALALETQRELRQQYLEPLLQGPLGKMAERDITTRRAIEAVFPKEPLAGSAQEVETAVRALAHRNPRAAADLVAAHAEGVFNTAAKNLQGGANQMGGANFVKQIAGNAQQRDNLEAAVRALPNGDQTWAGFNRFLEIAQATGTRQNIGSKTAYNATELKDMSSGGLVGNAVKTGASPGKWVTVISDAWGRWQLGNNVDQLARILTDPQSGRLLRAIASRPKGGREAEIIAGRLIYNATTQERLREHR
jgi:hypothetical protein